MRLFSLALAGFALGAACTSETTPPAASPVASAAPTPLFPSAPPAPPPPPSQTVAPPPAPPAPPPTPPPAATGKNASPTAVRGNRPKGWTDPRVVAALAQHCDYAPPPRELGEDEAFAPEDVFACTLDFQQACMPNECDDESHACRHACEGVCGSCGAACTKTCGTCEAACKDDACRQACAATTASCKDTCTRTMDRCATGSCASSLSRCVEMRGARVKKNRCDAQCKTFNACDDACNDDRCNARCSEALSPGYKACTDRCTATGGGDVTVAHCRRACSEATACVVSDCM
jgi:hypothetical protein